MFSLQSTLPLCRKLRSSHSIRQNSSMATIRLYRILLKQLKALPDHGEWLLQPPLHPRDYGRAKLVKTFSGDGGESLPDMLQIFQSWNSETNDSGDDDDDGYDERDKCVWITTDQLKTSIQEGFRACKDGDSLIQRQRVAIEASQALIKQQEMFPLLSVSTNEENNLRVVATSR